MAKAKVKYQLAPGYKNLKMTVQDVCVEVGEQGYETSDVHEIMALDGTSMVERVGGGTASSATLEEDS